MIHRLITLFAAITIALNLSAQRDVLYFKSGELVMEPSGDLKEDLNSLPGDGTFRYGLMTFSSLPTQKEKAELEGAGLVLLDYMPKNAFFVRVSSGAYLPSNVEVKGIYPLPARAKLSEELAKNEIPQHALVGNSAQLNVLLFDGFSMSDLEIKLGELGGSIHRKKSHLNWASIEVPLNEWNNVATISGVQYVEAIDAPGEPENIRGRTNHRMASLTKNYTGLSNELDGSGMHVMLQDDGDIGPHIDYTGRITQFTNFNQGDHGDHTGGTIMAAGNLDPRYKGMAPGAHIYVYGAASQGYPGFDSIASHYTKYDIKITSTSYSNGCNAGYTSLARELDIQTEQMDALSHVFSAGNNGTSNCNYGAGPGYGNITGGHKVAKNVITVANLDYRDQLANSSSRGPARDGRIKPDIAGVGTQVMSTTNPNEYVRKTGTSMSCPGVAGVLTGLYQAYKEFNNNQYPDQELMKGVICNSADDLGRKGVDFDFGFGRINARKAFDVIRNRNYFSGSVTNGDSASHSLMVPNGVQEVKIMLIWKDPRGATNSSRPLVNDLDVVVDGPGLPTVQPSIPDHRPGVDTSLNKPLYLNNPAQPGRDSINNIEQVVINGAVPGVYTIKIKGHSVPMGPQKYYVVYSYEPEELVLEYPVGGESFTPGETEHIRWSAYGTGQTFVIEYSTDSGSTWNTVGSASASQRYFDWRVPNLLSGKAKIRVRGSNHSAESPEVFSIVPVTNSLSVAKACPTYVELQWNTVNGATSYTAYKLGQKYMDPLGDTTSNRFRASGSWYNPYQQYWFSVSANGPDNAKGRRIRAIQTNGNLINCPLNLDLATSEFTSEVNYVSSCISGGSLKIGVKLKNEASSAITNPDLYYSLNGSAPVKETYNGSIAAGDTLVYNFTNSPQLSQTNNDLVVWVDYNSNENPFNDTLKAYPVFINDQPKPSCYVTTFDSVPNCSNANDCGGTSCSLPSGWVNFQNGVADDIDWRLYNQPTRTNQTGPTVDNTLENPGFGRYIYLESSGECENQEAILLSPCVDLRSSNIPFLDFHYHMYGNTMGSLRVDILSNGVWIENVWSMSGNQGNIWNNQLIDLSPYKGGIIQVRFVGTTGNGFRSDIALDDINFVDETEAAFQYTQLTGSDVSFDATTQSATSWIWDFGDNSPAGSGKQPVHTYGAPGMYNVTLIAVNNCSSDTIVREVNVNATGIRNNALSNDWKIYPQPAKDMVTIEAPVNAKIQNVEVLETTGKLVSTKVIGDAEKVNIEVGNLPRGTYILRITNEASVKSSLITLE